jgi:hypothetical protein
MGPSMGNTLEDGEGLVSSIFTNVSFALRVSRTYNYGTGFIFGMDGAVEESKFSYWVSQLRPSPLY